MWPLDAVIEHALDPAQRVIGNGGCATLDDGLQHVIHMARLDFFQLELAQMRANILVDTTTNNIKSLPQRRSESPARNTLFARSSTRTATFRLDCCHGSGLSLLFSPATS